MAHIPQQAWKSAIQADMQPYEHFAITTSDSVNFANLTRFIYVGGAGNIVIVSEGGTVVTYMGVPVGTVLPIRAKRVNATLTTATNLVGMY